jgi:hypothetical protein
MKEISNSTDDNSEVLANSNLENIYRLLHEFRKWNKEWDIHLSKHPSAREISSPPKHIDEFANLLSERYKVERTN